MPGGLLLLLCSSFLWMKIFPPRGWKFGLFNLEFQVFNVGYHVGNFCRIFMLQSCWRHWSFLRKLWIDWKGVSHVTQSDFLRIKATAGKYSWHLKETFTASLRFSFWLATIFHPQLYIEFISKVHHFSMWHFCSAPLHKP